MWLNILRGDLEIWRESGFAWKVKQMRKQWLRKIKICVGKENNNLHGYSSGTSEYGVN